ncbi:MAG TPA: hypothetical protein PLA43_03670 [Bryobacteraceae bacterium]|nr:hypothetical protein [Bryobacteraceae bacterium]HPU71028.1 hypothetical protein [Bryobacteraceae bacterium]
MHLSRLSHLGLQDPGLRPERSTAHANTAESSSRSFAELMRRRIENQTALAKTQNSNSLLNRVTPFNERLAAAARPSPQVTESGAPKIVPCDPWPGYSGPAATNPYFGLPLREGNVVGFSNWFQSIEIGGLGACTLPPAFSATEEGAQEALRLVQQYVPEARIQPYIYTGQIGSTRSHAIVLPNGEWLNAGLLLDAYYHQGMGVDANSDAMLKAEIAQLTGSS